jgi:hypothetical protein
MDVEERLGAGESLASIPVGITVHHFERLATHTRPWNGKCETPS